jgi:hypothetical protein
VNLSCVGVPILIGFEIQQSVGIFQGNFMPITEVKIDLATVEDVTFEEVSDGPMEGGVVCQED